MSGAFAQHFLDWATQNVTIEPYSSSDPYGANLYGAPVSIPCVIEEKIRMIRDVNGQERMSTTTLYLISDAPIDPRSRVTLPVMFQGAPKLPIGNVSNYSDQHGYSHTEVYL